MELIMDVSFDPADIVPRYQREIIMASYLYYHAKDGEPESPISDAEYDQRVQYVVANWSYTTPEFRKRITKDDLAASGHSLVASKKEITEARRWAGNCKCNDCACGDKK